MGGGIGSPLSPGEGLPVTRQAGEATTCNLTAESAAGSKSGLLGGVGPRALDLEQVDLNL